MTNAIENKAIKMTKTITVDGLDFELRRTLSGWVYCFLEGYTVNFRRPVDGRCKWTAWRSLAQESIAVDDTLIGVFKKTKAHFISLLHDKSLRA